MSLVVISVSSSTSKNVLSILDCLSFLNVGLTLKGQSGASYDKIKRVDLLFKNS